MRRGIVTLLAFTASCTTTPLLPEEGDTESAAPQPTTTTSGSLPAPSTGDLTSSADDATTNGASSDSVGTGCDFLCRPDVPPIEPCDAWNDDCPRGEKCTFRIESGGDTWCVPLDPDPLAHGAPCTPQAFGLDDCDAGSICQQVDGEAPGVCVPFCVGTPRSPTCEDSTASCFVTGGGVALCIPPCDPLDPLACPEGLACRDSVDGMICLLDESRRGGGLFESCAASTECDPGLRCEASENLSLCPANSACCTPYCDLMDPQCPDGTSCQPLPSKDPPPPGVENFGSCRAG
ncbi:MAG: hypothetical protein AAGA54_20050 [Myxococcota bacterium]